MNEGLQIYKFNSLTVYQKNFYNMTGLNFMYNRRRLFSFNKNGVRYNKYFPFDIVKEKLKFYGLYLSAYSIVDSFSHMDFDFDIGFNNVRYKIEEKIIDILISRFNKIEVILKIFNSRENKNIIEKIKKEYKILFSADGFYNVYITEIKEIKKAGLVQEYISGILVNRRDFQLQFEHCSFDTADLKFIKQMTEKYDLILFRASIYANYNIIIYSNNGNLINKLNDKILKLNNNQFNVENINSLENPGNFLLAWL